MVFDWDDAKSERMRQDRGYDLAYAACIFLGDTSERQDTRHDYGEVRMIAVGRVGGRLLTVVYTDRDGVRRLITSWPASQKEKQSWSERR